MLDLEFHRKALGEAALDSSLLETALEGVGREFGAEFGIFWSVESNLTPTLHPLVSWGNSVGLEAFRFAQNCGRQDPWVEGAVTSGRFFRSGVSRGSDLANQSDWDRSPWVDFIREFGRLELLTFLEVDRQSIPTVVLSFLKPHQSGLFSDKAVQGLSALSRDLSFTAGVLREFTSLRAQVQGLASLLDSLEEAAWLLTPSREIIWMNALAEATLLEGSVFCSRRNLLDARMKEAARQLEIACQFAARGRGQVIRLPLEDGGVLRVRLVPVTVNSRSLIAAFSGLDQRNRLATPWQELVAQQFGLTNAETSVVDLLCSGLSPLEIATKRGTGLATTRAQLSSIFAKLGVTGQSQAVAKIIRYRD